MLPGVAGTKDCKKPITILTTSLDMEDGKPVSRYSVIAIARLTLFLGIQMVGVEEVSYSKPQNLTLGEGGSVFE